MYFEGAFITIWLTRSIGFGITYMWENEEPCLIINLLCMDMYVFFKPLKEYKKLLKIETLLEK